MYIRGRSSSILEPYRSEMLKKILFVVSVLAVARAQIPSLGWCPEYVPMANFDMGKFMGVWFEAERYFQLTEVVSRCVMTNYTKGPDGKLRVSNEVTNRFTGIKRILEGEIKPAASKAEEGKLHVKYTTVPLTPETQYSVLETDYKNYAVLWSCSGIGPVHTQNAWLMFRSPRPSGETLQKAYGVLDKYKISKAFFVKTNQEDCAYLDGVTESEKPAAKPTEKPVVEEAAEEEVVEEAQQVKTGFNLRSAIIPDAPAIAVEAEQSENAAAEPAVEAAAEPAAVISAEPVQADEAKPVAIAEPAEVSEGLLKGLNAVEEPAEVEVGSPAVTVPEVILKTADLAKEIVKEAEPAAKKVEASAEQAQEALEKPAKQLPDFIQKPYDQFQQFVQNSGQQLQDAIPEQVADYFTNAGQQFQANVQKPVENFFGNPAQAIQSAFQQKPQKPTEKPSETIKEAVNEAAAVVADTLPAAIKEPELSSADENQNSEKKIES